MRAHVECFEDGEYVESVRREDVFNVQLSRVQHRGWERLDVVCHCRLLHHLHPLPRPPTLTA